MQTKRPSMQTKRPSMQTKRPSMQTKRPLKRPSKKASKKIRVFKKKDYISGDGMLTTVWGPSLWHFLHIMSFNYPINPTTADQAYYKHFMLSLQYILPCKYCRQNLKVNFQQHPLLHSDLLSRDAFSRYIYLLHERINTLLGKVSGLTYCDVRERYEHFRSRCTAENPTTQAPAPTTQVQAPTTQVQAPTTQVQAPAQVPAPSKPKEMGCTEPLYGKKAKCIIKIVPHEKKCPTLQIDQKCLKRRPKP